MLLVVSYAMPKVRHGKVITPNLKIPQKAMPYLPDNIQGATKNVESMLRHYISLALLAWALGRG
jgi:hypothetical protein